MCSIRIASFLLLSALCWIQDLLSVSPHIPSLPITSSLDYRQSSPLSSITSSVKLLFPRLASTLAKTFFSLFGQRNQISSKKFLIIRKASKVLKTYLCCCHQLCKPLWTYRIPPLCLKTFPSLMVPRIHCFGLLALGYQPWIHVVMLDRLRVSSDLTAAPMEEQQVKVPKLTRLGNLSTTHQIKKSLANLHYLQLYLQGDPRSLPKIPRFHRSRS